VSIRDGVRQGWVWHGQRTILRGDGVNWELGSRDGWAADLEHSDPAPCAGARYCNGRKQLGSLRGRVTASLRAFGFSIDPADSAQLRSRDGNRYIIYQLSYPNPNETGAHLRPTIQVELKLQRAAPAVDRPTGRFLRRGSFQSVPGDNNNCLRQRRRNSG
jgi:hypothetical protein